MSCMTLSTSGEISASSSSIIDVTDLLSLKCSTSVADIRYSDYVSLSVSLLSDSSDIRKPSSAPSYMSYS